MGSFWIRTIFRFYAFIKNWMVESEKTQLEKGGGQKGGDGKCLKSSFLWVQGTQRRARSGDSRQGGEMGGDKSD